MSTTLVAIFATDTEAHEACRKLEAAGIDKNRMRVSSDDEVASMMLASAKPGAQPEKEHGAVRRFFADLFADSGSRIDDRPAEADRRGNVVLSVNLVNEARTDAIGDLLEDCGATHVDERVEAWAARGSAPPGTPGPMAMRDTFDEPVGSRSARLLDEAGVEKQASDRHESLRELVRRTEVDLERMAGPPQGARRSTQRPYTGVERRVRRAPHAHDERRAAAW